MTMKQLILGLSLAFATCAWSLPIEVETDRLTIQANSVLKSKDFSGAAEIHTQAAKLGIGLPEEFYLEYGASLGSQLAWAQARDVLGAYLEKYKTAGKLYKPALELYMKAEEQAKSSPGVRPNNPPPVAVAAATVALAQRTRPQLPLTLSEDVWQAIERSESYPDAPRTRAVEVNVALTSSIQEKHLVSDDARTVSKTYKPLSPGYTELKMVHSSRGVTSGIATSSDSASTSYSALGGMLLLGTVDANGETSFRLKRVDELSGSLFPPKVGASLRTVYEIEYPMSPQMALKVDIACAITHMIDANTLDPKLTGKAWTMSCTGTKKITGVPVIPVLFKSYYLEDLGMPLDALGEYDMERKVAVLPPVGYTYSLVTTGKYGSTNTFVINRFDWRELN